MKIKPSFAEFKKMAQQGNLIPVYQEFLADTETPVSAYLKLRDGSYSYLLESAGGGKRWGRYSFIGCRPFIRVVARSGAVELWQGDRLKVCKDVQNPLNVLRDISAGYKPVTVGDLPPFQVGAGIVADSSPAGEYEETLKKAGAMFKAIERVKVNDTAHRQL